MFENLVSNPQLFADGTSFISFVHNTDVSIENLITSNKRTGVSMKTDSELWPYQIGLEFSLLYHHSWRWPTWAVL